MKNVALILLAIGIPLLIVIPTGNASPRKTLLGRWYQPCENGVLKTEDFRSFDVTLTEMFFLTKDCSRPSLIFINEGPYSLPEDNQIDFEFKSVRVRLMSDIAVRDFNRRQVCGFNDWSLGLEKEISGRSCEIFLIGVPQRLPTVGEMRYGIYQVINGRLSFGKITRENDAKTPDKRPTEYNSRFYQRIPRVRPNVSWP